MRNLLKKGSITTALGLSLCTGCSASHPAAAEMSQYTLLAPAGSFGQIAANSPLRPFQRLFSNLNRNSIESQLDEVYADPLFFNDTFHTLSSRGALKAYLMGLAEAAETQVTLLDSVQNGNDFLVRWTMHTRAEVGWRTLDINSIGMTHLRFDNQGKIILHQDFWDAAGGFYEHLPLLGSSIKAIRSQLKD